MPDSTSNSPETLIYQTGLHPRVLIQPAPQLALALISFIVGRSFTLFTLLGWIILAVGVMTAVEVIGSYRTATFLVTNRRVLLRTGFLRRYGIELPLQNVETIGAYQKWSDWIFGSGTVVVTGLGGTRTSFPAVANAARLREQILGQLYTRR